MVHLTLKQILSGSRGSKVTENLNKLRVRNGFLARGLFTSSNVFKKLYKTISTTTNKQVLCTLMESLMGVVGGLGLKPLIKKRV